MANNKTIIIFGATGSVGAALIDALHKDPKSIVGISDPKIVAVDHDDKGNKQLESKYKIHTMTKDAAKPQDVMDVYNMHKNDGILGIVSVIGGFHMQPIQNLTPDDLLATVKNELMPAFNILKGGADLLAGQNGGGSLVCCSAAVVHLGMKNHEAFAAAKGAIEAMHKSAAASYAPKNVRINCVAPGLLSDNPQLDRSVMERSAKLYPMKRLVEPSEVAAAIGFLLGRATFTTGSVLFVDGGLAELAPQGMVGHAEAPHGQA